MRKTICLFLLCFATQIFAQNPAATYLPNQTPTYKEVIAFYKQLEHKHMQVKLFEQGKTDIGMPLHVLLVTNDGDFDLLSIRKKNKRIILINNGIHPGEPDGVNACMQLTEDLMTKPSMKALLQHVVLAIIPVYNIDGALNRSCCSRANQDGPEEYGFRGNARNLDLNRDFIKCDSENAQSFSAIFHWLRPEILVDTHVSDGADYQYTMTLITTQHNKLNTTLAKYMQEKLVPKLYAGMKDKGQEMSPYVNTHNETPDGGIEEFLETPRFSTGYAALFNTIGFVTETHMLKPFDQRVKATYQFLQTLLEVMDKEYVPLKTAKLKADEEVAHTQQAFDLNWQIDTTQYTMLTFNGYAAMNKTSTISGLQRLYYDRSKPYNKPVRFYNRYKSAVSVQKPLYYVVPQAWKEVISRLQLNHVVLQRLPHDTLMRVELYHIQDYKTNQRPYEGHYLHSNITLRCDTQLVQYFKGDYIVNLNQQGNRYIIETLEPQAVDSYFAWNFFDSILQQKEGYSDYVFEEKAEAILQQNPSLKAALEQRRLSDKAFAESHNAQLSYIYQHSPYFEKSYMRYPVGRGVK